MKVSYIRGDGKGQGRADLLFTLQRELVAKELLNKLGYVPRAFWLSAGHHRLY